MCCDSCKKSLSPRPAPTVLIFLSVSSSFGARVSWLVGTRKLETRSCNNKPRLTRDTGPDPAHWRHLAHRHTQHPYQHQHRTAPTLLLHEILKHKPSLYIRRLDDILSSCYCIFRCLLLHNVMNVIHYRYLQRRMMLGLDLIRVISY